MSTPTPKVLLLCRKRGGGAEAMPAWVLLLVGSTMLGRPWKEAKLNAARCLCRQHQCMDRFSWHNPVMCYHRQTPDWTWVWPVPFVMRIPTILWCRVPSLPCWWLGVHSRPNYCTTLPTTQEWKGGLKWSDAEDIQVRGAASSSLIPHFSLYWTDLNNCLENESNSETHLLV